MSDLRGILYSDGQYLADIINLVIEEYLDAEGTPTYTGRFWCLASANLAHGDRLDLALTDGWQMPILIIGEPYGYIGDYALLQFQALGEFGST